MIADMSIHTLTFSTFNQFINIIVTLPAAKLSKIVIFDNSLHRSLCGAFTSNSVSGTALIQFWILLFKASNKINLILINQFELSIANSSKKL